MNILSAINPDEIISILKEEIENYDEISRNQEIGTVISVGDGIATVYGIDHAMYGEVVVFDNGLKGMVQDIRSNSMGCILSEVIPGSVRDRRFPGQADRRVFPLATALSAGSSTLLELLSTEKAKSKKANTVRWSIPLRVLLTGSL